MKDDNVCTGFSIPRLKAGVQLQFNFPITKFWFPNVKKPFPKLFSDILFENCDKEFKKDIDKWAVSEIYRILTTSSN